MLPEARQTTLDGYFRRDPYARRAFGGRHRALHYVTNIILHNPDNALQDFGERTIYIITISTVLQVARAVMWLSLR